jgi:hypothetical protein
MSRKHEVSGPVAIDKKTLRQVAFECLDRIVLNRKVHLVRLSGLKPSGAMAH